VLIVYRERTYGETNISGWRPVTILLAQGLIHKARGLVDALGGIPAKPLRRPRNAGMPWMDMSVERPGPVKMGNSLADRPR
jgi:hypothetical protein